MEHKVIYNAGFQKWLRNDWTNQILLLTDSDGTSLISLRWGVGVSMQCPRLLPQQERRTPRGEVPSSVYYCPQERPRGAALRSASPWPHFSPASGGPGATAPRGAELLPPGPAARPLPTRDPQARPRPGPAAALSPRPPGAAPRPAALPVTLGRWDRAARGLRPRSSGPALRKGGDANLGPTRTSCSSLHAARPKGSGPGRPVRALGADQAGGASPLSPAGSGGAAPPRSQGATPPASGQSDRASGRAGPWGACSQGY